MITRSRNVHPVQESVNFPASGGVRSRGMLRIATLAFAALQIVALAGCGAARPVRYYQLTVPTDMPQSTQGAQGISLAVGPLMASHLYREDRLVYSTGTRELGTYEYQRWSEPPTEMIQEVILRELQASGRYRDITSQRSATHVDYLLHGQLYDFKEVAGGNLSARVTAEWELRDTKTGNTVWTHYYSHDEPVASKDVPALVAALDQNVQRCVGELKSGLEQYFSSVPAAETK
jgi:cholesterol transport system auxiliary component